MKSKTQNTAIADMKCDGVIQLKEHGGMVFGPSHLIQRVWRGLQENKPQPEIIDFHYVKCTIRVPA